MNNLQKNISSGFIILRNSCLIAVCSILMQCSSKAEPPRNNVFKQLRAGLSLDSAKIIASEAGWPKGTIVPSRGKLVTLEFSPVYFQGIQPAFTALLIFKSLKLESYTLGEMYSQGSRSATHESSYQKLAGALGNSFGPPNYTTSSVNHPVQSATQLDTLYTTMWFDSTRLIVLVYDMRNGITVNVNLHEH